MFALPPGTATAQFANICSSRLALRAFCLASCLRRAVFVFDVPRIVACALLSRMPNSCGESGVRAGRELPLQLAFSSFDASSGEGEPCSAGGADVRDARPDAAGRRCALAARGPRRRQLLGALPPRGMPRGPGGRGPDLHGGAGEELGLRRLGVPGGRRDAGLVAGRLPRVACRGAGESRVADAVGAGTAAPKPTPFRTESYPHTRPHRGRLASTIVSFPSAGLRQTQDCPLRRIFLRYVVLGVVGCPRCQ